MCDSHCHTQRWGERAREGTPSLNDVLLEGDDRRRCEPNCATHAKAPLIPPVTSTDAAGWDQPGPNAAAFISPISNQARKIPQQHRPCAGLPEPEKEAPLGPQSAPALGGPQAGQETVQGPLPDSHSYRLHLHSCSSAHLIHTRPGFHQQR
ncbi:hypothetical protein AAFF_G00235420 [Aldrovandia affinis]|uniref:Uncharacterized protein n=1 Tax=Aldrovandia affinis TaxID=143900 RepID=A0AAD7SV16_9TELE|nr:hypothetical protein AAFF_G00235420 [Aldrovandia affinis]